MEKVIVKIPVFESAKHPCNGCLYEKDAAGCSAAPSCTADGDYIFVEGEIISDGRC